MGAVYRLLRARSDCHEVPGYIVGSLANLHDEAHVAQPWSERLWPIAPG